MSGENSALRYNEGKTRLGLIPTELLEGVGQVLTYGANKYTVKNEAGEVTSRGDNNWRKGLPWTSVIDSLERHLLSFKKGEDFDSESNLLHLAHCATNIAFLMHYYKSHPEMDDRFQIRRPRIGLDVDEVVADWVGSWTKKHNQDIPEFWSFDKDIKVRFETLKDDKEFWMSIKPLIEPKELGFEPACFITSRNIPTEWTVEWLQNNKFPCVPVYTVSHTESKVAAAKEAKLDWFIDDRFENYLDLNKAGVCTFLLDAPHNRRYDVGYKRVMNFKDFKSRFL